MKSIYLGALLMAGGLALGAPLFAGSATWNVDADGNWTDAGSWTAGGPPNGPAETAGLTFDITADRVVTLNADQTASTLTVGDSTANFFGYTLGGSSTLTLDNSGSGVSITKAGGGNTALDVIDVPITTKGNLTIHNAASGGFLTINGAIANDGTNRNLLVTGTGAGNSGLITLTSASTYGGTTTLGGSNVGARLRITNGSALGTGAIASIAGGGSSATTSSLELSGGITLNNNISSLGGTSVSVTTVPRLTSIAGLNIYAGEVQNVSTGGGDYPIHSTGTAPGDFFTITGNITNNRGVVDNRNLRLGGAGNGEVTGLIRQTNLSIWHVIKDSAGTWILSANNTYTGATTVNAGFLQVNGSHSTGQAYSVQNGGTLGGIGTIGSQVVVNSGGILAPGASIGTLNVSSVNLAGTLKVEYNGDASAIDLLNVTGALDITAATVDFDNLGVANLHGGPFVLATYGSLVGSAFASTIDPPVGYSLDFDYQGNKIALVASSLPGDFDSDGDVDGADFIAWQTNFPTASGATQAQGDADGDTDVDGADFSAWQSSFPSGPAPGVASVPEPNTFVTWLIGALLAIFWRKSSVPARKV
jgi:autotransporter-associated beta strand protein